MAAELLVYKDNIVDLLGAVKDRLNPSIHQRLRAEAGIDADHLKPSYRLAQQDTAVQVLAQELYPSMPLEESTFQIGHAVTTRFSHSLLGRALFLMIRLSGPIRSFAKQAPHFRRNNNYAVVRIDVEGPTAYSLHHNEVGQFPHYLRGGLYAAAEGIQLQNYRATLAEYDGHQATYRVAWDG